MKNVNSIRSNYAHILFEFTAHSGVKQSKRVKAHSYGNGGKGYGVELVKYTIALIKKTMAYDFILVIGDYHYYEKFGFKRIDNTFSFYGPVNSEKVLILHLKDELKNNDYKIMEFN